MQLILRKIVASVGGTNQANNKKQNPGPTWRQIYGSWGEASGQFCLLGKRKRFSVCFCATKMS